MSESTFCSSECALWCRPERPWLSRNSVRLEADTANWKKLSSPACWVQASHLAASSWQRLLSSSGVQDMGNPVGSARGLALEVARPQGHHQGVAVATVGHRLDGRGLVDHRS